MISFSEVIIVADLLKVFVHYCIPHKSLFRSTPGRGAAAGENSLNTSTSSLGGGITNGISIQWEFLFNTVEKYRGHTLEIELPLESVSASVHRGHGIDTIKSKNLLVFILTKTPVVFLFSEVSYTL